MCSLEHDQTINIGPKRQKQTVDIPEGIDVDIAMRIYNQGWGHATANALHYFTQHVDVVPDYGSDFQSDEFITWMNEKRSKRNVHL